MPPTEEFPWDDLRKIVHGGQKVTKVQNGEEILPKILIPHRSRAHERYRQQTDDRRTTENNRNHSQRRESRHQLQRGNYHRPWIWQDNTVDQGDCQDPTWMSKLSQVYDNIIAVLGEWRHLAESGSHF